MKRYECTVESLKALGYIAKHGFNGSWRTKAQAKECTEQQSKEVFAIIARIVRAGGCVEIQQNNYNYTVNVYAKEVDFGNTPANDYYFLSRPMSEAERLEADLYTGRGKDWDYINAE